ncbi:MAG TPA: hypothetical protein DDZ39_03820 [Flavobacteriaceae bacterium]|jgi:hypothetical protein|nr:hypothetical protein [Flavobacteriaceae bacterium]HBS12516.1 hypothetical protein [Flavobacteriaceae bacterium]
MSTETPQRKKYESLSHGFGITGLIVAIVTLLTSFIPCFGIFAFIFGILAILISGIGLIIALIHGHSKGLIMGALITALLGCSIAYAQFSAMESIGSDEETEMHKEIEKQDNKK